MKKSILKNLMLVLALAPLGQSPGLAVARYSQMMVSFNSERQVSFYSQPGSNSLVIEFANTTPSELANLEMYDEKLVRRLIFKDLGANGTQVQLVLRDSAVRATVNQFSEPFRVAIDLFDQNYQEQTDLVTGFPRLQSASEPEIGTIRPGVQTDLGNSQSPRRFVSEDGQSQGEYPQSNTRDDRPKGSYQLVKPTAKEIGDSGQFAEEIEKIESGKGKAWRNFPEYIYRLQTSSFEVDAKEDHSELSKATKALSSTEAMASYAGRLFNFGHESRAFFGYQQVLRREPAIFDRDALHLWKFAEIHLGQGNLTLAEGYFKALIDKHPDSLLSKFAELRRLDIASIRVINDGKMRQLNALVPKLDHIKAAKSAELTAQVAIRRAYWNDLQLPDKYTSLHIPTVEETLARLLSEVHPALESQTTSFLAATIILNDLLKPENPWSNATSVFAGTYFSRYSGDVAKQHQDDLRARFNAKLNSKLQEYARERQFSQVVATVKALPKSLSKVAYTPETSWALANSYREMGFDEDAISYYQKAADGANNPKDRLQPILWLAITAANSSAQLSRQNDSAKASKMSDLARNADQEIERIWSELKPAEKRAIMVSYKDALESNLTSEFMLRSPAVLILSTWKERLGTHSSADSSIDGKWEAAYSPSASAVMLLKRLSERFAKLGMVSERREAIKLLQFIKPEEIQDKDSKKIWADSLLGLAEDYRNTNEYLEAGRLYAFAAEKNEDWPNRAEALYKGGLLLYRAGKRDEAIKAFQQASEDGQNEFYANLAKERIERLQK